MTDQRQLRTAIFPGSFDPITNGHVDIIRRALRLFDRVVVAVLVNASKEPYFTAADRVAIVREVFAGEAAVDVETFDGLLVDYARRRQVTAIVKGLRAVSDFDYELQMAQMNSSLAEIETVFVPTSPEWSFLASSLVKEVATFGGDVSGLLPEFVRERLVQRLDERRRDKE